MRTDQIKPTQEIVSAKAITAVSSDTEKGIKLTGLPLDPFCKEFPGLLLKPLYDHKLGIFIQLASLNL